MMKYSVSTLPGQNYILRLCTRGTSNLFCTPSRNLQVPRYAALQNFSLTSMASDKKLPPNAKKVPHFNTYHGEKYVDEYHWLRDDKRENKEVLDHLKAENEYSESLLAPLKPLADQIYHEIIGRMVEDDETYPELKGGFGYYQKTVKGLQYPIRCRKRIDEGSSANEEVLLDLNLIEEEQLDLQAFEISPDHKLLAYTLDTEGDEKYSLFVKDLSKGTTSEEAKEVSAEAFWSNDGQHLYYTTQDDIHRSYRLFRHKLGGQQSSDELLFEEKDLKFSVDIQRSMSKKYLFLTTEKSTATEVHYIDLDMLNSPLSLFSARAEDRRYSLEHQNDSFLVLTNRYNEKKYINSLVLRSSITPESNEKDWAEVVPYDDEHYITDLLPFEKYVVLEERFGGYSQLRVVEASSGIASKDEGRLIKFPEPIFSVFAKRSYIHYNSTELFFEYTSLTTPKSLFSYDLATRFPALLKTEPIKGDFDSSKYVAERVVAPNNVPISLVYRNDLFKKDGSNPLHLYGYGSYGICIDPRFSSSIMSLLDRGFVYAIAHIRGGAEMGRQWYETEGKFLQKKNTFRDFSDAAHHLINEKYTSSERLSIEGRSAGGLLMGAVINLNSGLFNAAIAGVPFVDVINTMMDPTIPLTVNEYEEWGDPNMEEFFTYMKSYSPYDNLPETGEGLPHLLVRAGLNDPRVQYWEPAKYVARLRAIISESPDISHKHIAHLIKMGAGHFGSSGRYDRFKDVAQDYAFLVATAEKKEPFL
ncbi:hypothetical protein DSO57_1000829 [Entomophthora muscae]|uniref:Uncharacterized protein n=1 Tax=Entomophthora muscae TaxID=34485 RepID=A0ACC2U7R6_9FUNG|nr:hypothetical protein DSO57_1000829 [Entomophthora muscae]